MVNTRLPKNFSRFLRPIKLQASVLILMLGAAVAGCTDDTPDFNPSNESTPQNGYITLTVNCLDNDPGAESRTDSRYTEAANENFNENKISSITVCLWYEGGDKADDNATPNYVRTFNDVDKYGSATINIPLTTEMIGTLFKQNNSNTCHAFVVANVAPPTGQFTIAQYRQKAIGSTFDTQFVQDDFAMDGDKTLQYSESTNSVSGTIDLRRSASKITLALNVDESVEQTVVVGGEEITGRWVPDISNMKVYLRGGLKTSTIDPVIDIENNKESEFFSTPNDRPYTFSDGNTDNGNAPGNSKYPYLQNIPFYTYPHRWTAEPTDYAATYMILTVPWENENDPGTFRTCYYQVPVIPATSDPLLLVRNMSYHVYLHVSVLGSFTPDEPLELTDLSFAAAEWGTENIDVNLDEIRYLVVDQNTYTVNNETSYAINFYSSHETVVTDATMTFYRYNYSDVGDELPVTVTMRKNHDSYTTFGDSVFVAYYNNKTNQLEYGHDLIMYVPYNSSRQPVSLTYNDGPTVTTKRNPRTKAEWDTNQNTITSFRRIDYPGASYSLPEYNVPLTVGDIDEYSRIEVTITVQHADWHELHPGSTNFSETVTITQYPGMYITAQQNTSEDNTEFNFSGAQGNTFINGNTTGFSFGGNTYLGGNMPEGWTTSIGLNTSYLNYNPNMYLVTITNLSEKYGEKYKLGDPRSTNANINLSNSNVNNTNNTLWTGSTYRFSWPNFATARTLNTTGFTTNAALDLNSSSKTTPRRLQYYYPALEDESTKNMIAPKFRICSSYAGTSFILNRELGRRRAAAYQEMNFPAGRWRLPTNAEVEYMMTLAEQFKIPRLFGRYDQGETWGYWCAHGLMMVPRKSSQNPAYLVEYAPNNKVTIWITTSSSHEFDNINDQAIIARARFVYDEWYWGETEASSMGYNANTTPNYQYTLGDAPYEPTTSSRAMSRYTHSEMK